MDVMVSVTDDGQEHFAAVVAALQTAGMRVSRVEEAAGVVLGSVDPDRVDALMDVPGVGGVEPQRKFRIAPPEADVQ